LHNTINVDQSLPAEKDLYNVNLPLANAGVPMLFVQENALILTLPAVIAIETWLCCKLYRTTWKQTLRASVIANGVSTFLGFPILWYFWLTALIVGGGGSYGFREPWNSIYQVTVHAAWLSPNESEYFWMIPTAMLVLLIPAFFVSVFVERWIYRYLLKDQLAGSHFKKESWIIHIASYSFLILAGIGLLVHSIMNHAVK
jgi:hypothetical protein